MLRGYILDFFSPIFISDFDEGPDMFNFCGFHLAVKAVLAGSFDLCSFYQSFRYIHLTIFTDSRLSNQFCLRKIN